MHRAYLPLTVVHQLGKQLDEELTAAAPEDHDADPLSSPPVDGW